MAEIRRLSLNQATTEHWSAQQAIEGCVRHGIPSIALWRHKIKEAGLKACVQMTRDARLHVSSVCRGGMWPAATAEERRERMEENRRAADECAELGGDSLVLVVGACREVPIADARKMVEEGLAALAPYARERGVRLGLEPLHPMYAGERSVLNTIDQALALASGYDAGAVGVILDTFHIWWDPYVYEQIARARGRIYGFHVCDWLVPLPDMLMGRGMMGDGVAHNRGLREAIDGAGYGGPIEVEIFNQAIWDTPGDVVLERMIERFAALV
jgi:sugar phosphate isomerase/epimerase